MGSQASAPATMDPCNGNILLCTDSYKVSHHRQYPPETTTVHSYFESRGGKFDQVVFFGLQYLIKKWLVGHVVTQEKIDEAAEIYALHFGSDQVFNKAGWELLLAKHGGTLPLVIRAVPEGTIVPTRNVLFTVENTDPDFPWLTNWVETLLVQAWYPLTVATNSREQKKLLAKYLKLTADSLEGLPFKLHDFGFRGVSSVESAAIGGAAHLVNFVGTDTVAALVCARRCYGEKIAGFSIPAAEHSTITTWQRDGEADAFANMLRQFPTGLVAVVSDSYNIWSACSKLWGGRLKTLVEERGEKGGVLVVRPDSGYPPEVVVKCLELLGHAFGTTTNSRGYKMLPPFLRLIQGDGISLDMLDAICWQMARHGWSTDNVAFGSGGALLQKHDRDTQKCAFKCSFATVDGQDRDVFKSPVTDQGKKSKHGRLALLHEGDTWQTVQYTEKRPAGDQLQEIFRDGTLLVEHTFSEVRARADIPEPEEVELSATCPGKVDCVLNDEAQFQAWKDEWLQ